MNELKGSLCVLWIADDAVQSVQKERELATINIAAAP